MLQAQTHSYVCTSSLCTQKVLLNNYIKQRYFKLSSDFLDPQSSLLPFLKARLAYPKWEIVLPACRDYYAYDLWPWYSDMLVALNTMKLLPSDITLMQLVYSWIFLSIIKAECNIALLILGPRVLGSLVLRSQVPRSSVYSVSCSRVELHKQFVVPKLNLHITTDTFLGLQLQCGT